MGKEATHPSNQNTRERMREENSCSSLIVLLILVYAACCCVHCVRAALRVAWQISVSKFVENLDFFDSNFCKLRISIVCRGKLHHYLQDTRLLKPCAYQYHSSTKTLVCNTHQFKDTNDELYTRCFSLPRYNDHSGPTRCSCTATLCCV